MNVAVYKVQIVDTNYIIFTLTDSSCVHTHNRFLMNLNKKCCQFADLVLPSWTKLQLTTCAWTTNTSMHSYSATSPRATYVTEGRLVFNPLQSSGNYSATSIIWSWYTGRWWVGCYIWYSEEGTGQGTSPPRPLLAVPNVTVHPSTASVPITVLLYNGQLLCGLMWATNG